MALIFLCQMLNEYGLRRKNSQEIDDDEISTVIGQELGGSGCVSGYRAMWHTLRLKYGIKYQGT